MAGMNASSLSEDLRRLGAVIRERRLAVGLSQQQLAKRARCHLSSVGRVERGKQNVRLNLLYALAHGLEWKLVELLDAVDAPSGDGGEER